MPLDDAAHADKTTVKQFIRNVRASKTIADERAVVQKESAAIRASFREESGDHNVRFVIDRMQQYES
jgi:AP-1 complex subunit gamma-1